MTTPGNFISPGVSTNSPSANTNAVFQQLCFVGSPSGIHGAPKTLPASVLSEPLSIFETGHNTGFSVSSNAGSLSASSNRVPRGAIYSNVSPPIPNKFGFSYNPSSIGFSTQWDLSKPAFGSNVTGGGDSGGAIATIGNLGGVNTPESLSFEIVLNRIVEASDSYNGACASLFQTYGTIVDLSLLFRTINAATDAGIQAVIDSGPDTPVPPSNPGYLVAQNCKILFGAGNYVWYGYCTSVSVNHAKFINTMCPVLTTVDIQFQRTLSPGDTNAAEPSIPTIDPTTTVTKVKGIAVPGLVKTPLAQQFSSPNKGVMKP